MSKTCETARIAIFSIFTLNLLFLDHVTQELTHVTAPIHLFERSYTITVYSYRSFPAPCTSNVMVARDWAPNENIGGTGDKTGQVMKGGGGGVQRVGILFFGLDGSVKDRLHVRQKRALSVRCGSQIL
jgi:hypothetical protein